MADAFINRGSGQVLATGGDVALKAGKGDVDIGSKGKLTLGAARDISGPGRDGQAQYDRYR
jgi:hypothetical protein